MLTRTRTMRRCLPLIAAATILAVNPATAADHYGLEPQPLKLASAGPLAFGPDGILFVGDPQAATVHAIDTKAYRPSAAVDPQQAKYEIADVRAALAKTAGGEAADINVVDMAIDHEAGTLLLSITVGDQPALASVNTDGEAKLINLDKVLAASRTLADAPEDKVTGEGRRASNKRLESITDLAYADGAVLVSGLGGDSPLSTVREIPFPFRDEASSANIEIYHAAHGRSEDYAAIRAFIPINIDGKPSLLAGFTCTPLVRFSLDSLQAGAKVRGTTVAELGNRNRPLDMIIYDRDGKTFMLVTNTARGVMKIDTANVANQEELTEPVRGGGTAGLPFEQVDSLTGVVQLAKLGDAHGVIMTESDGKLALSTIELP